VHAGELELSTGSSRWSQNVDELVLPSENPINGKTLHKGHIARIVASYNRTFMAKQQKNSHTLSKETSNAPPQCPRHQIKA